jgi:uncharacterized membrane protein
MSDERDAIFEWAEAGRLEPGQLAPALRVAGAIPGVEEWRRFVDLLLLGLAVATIAAGAVFFVAANWHELGRFAKFALVEASIVLALALCWRYGLESLAGKASLVAAALCVGALLALVGQVYQTGADTWELFANWAGAIAAWVVIARMPVLWLLWLALVNVAVALYFSVFGGILGIVFGTREMLWALFGLNTSALAVWEVLAASGVAWLRGRSAVRVLAFASGAAITWLAVWSVLDISRVGGWGLVVYAAWLGALYAAYRRRSVDLFILSGAVLSAIIVVTVTLAHNLLQREAAGSFLFIGLFVIAMTAAGAWWLRQVAAEESA